MIFLKYWKEKTINKININDEIKSKTLRLISKDGKQIGIVSINEALNLAAKDELDLVEIQPKTNPPVCKIMNFGKFQFSENKKKSLAKKKQKEIKVKEMKFRINTGENDYLIKTKNLTNFLINGKKTKITVYFKGREIVYKHLGLNLINRICEDLSDFGKSETEPKFEGKNIIVVINPLKKE